MSPILIALPVFLLLVGLEIWLAKCQGKTLYRLNDAVTSINIGVMSEVFRALIKLLTVGLYALVVDSLGSFSFDLKNPLTWLLGILMYDFFYYWAHRAGHEVNLLWSAHVVHHSSEDFNLSTALRQSSTNWVFYWIFYMPMALLGIPVQVFVIAGLVSMLYQFWVHTQLIGQLGWYERYFVTPSNHRCHHGKNAYCIDVNYGGILIVWDRLFGTYAKERADEPVVYGTLSPINSWNPVWANFKNYSQLFHSVRTSKKWQHALMYLFAKPGWSPEQPNPAPPTTEQVQYRYVTPVNVWQTRYALFANACLIALLAHWLWSAPQLSVLIKALYGLTIVASAVGISVVFSAPKLAARIELARTALLTAAILSQYWFTPVSALFQTITLLAALVSCGLLGQLWKHSPEAIHNPQHGAAL